MVAIRFPAEIDAATFAIVRSSIDSAKPAFVEIQSPSGALICFKATAAQSARALLSRLHELRQSDARLRTMGTALHGGVVAYRTDWRRRVRSAPLGDEVNFLWRKVSVDSRTDR